MSLSRLLRVAVSFGVNIEIERDMEEHVTLLELTYRKYSNGESKKLECTDDE